MSSSFKPLGRNSLSGIILMIFLIAGPITALSQSDDSDSVTVHWGDTVVFNTPAIDPDTTNACEDLTFTMLQGPSSAELDSLTGHFFWLTTGDDICYTMVLIEIADGCGATSEYAMYICVTNDPPQATYSPGDTIYAAWGIELSGQVNATDPDNGPNNLIYRIISFDGPIYILW